MKLTEVKKVLSMSFAWTSMDKDSEKVYKKINIIVTR